MILNQTMTAEETEKAKAEKAKPIDPLRRVFVPRESEIGDGIFAFKTSDKQRYFRRQDGSIRRETPKMNGKEARRARRKAARRG